MASIPVLRVALDAKTLEGSDQLGDRGGGMYPSPSAGDFPGDRARAGERWLDAGLRLPDLWSGVDGLLVWGFGRECALVINGADNKAAPLLRERRWLREYGDRFRWCAVVDGRGQSNFSFSLSQPCRIAEGLGSVLLLGFAGRDGAAFDAGEAERGEAELESPPFITMMFSL